MRGWLIDGDDRWIWRFWRDESAGETQKCSLIGGRLLDGPPCQRSVGMSVRRKQSGCGSRFRPRDANHSRTRLGSAADV